MVKDKKSKINKMEKLRRILDNPSDPEIKKLISKDDKNLKTILRKVSGETSKSEAHVPSSESLAKKSENLGPIIAVHKNKEKTEPQTSTEKITSEVTSSVARKGKIIDFQDVEKDEIYRRTKRGLLSSDKIQIYKPITIIEMWAFTIIIGVVAASGLFLMRDWLFLNFGIYGDKFIPTPKGTLNIHIWFGFAFAVLGLFHLAIHIFSRNKDILPKKTLQDFKAFLHSGMYLIGFARREDYQTSGRYSGRQRITYLALVYILGLTTLTGFLYYMNLLSKNLALVHIIPAGLSIMVLLFHFLITVRNHDTVALRCAFVDGKIPRWYARKNIPIWYKERESIIKKLPHSVTHQTNNTMIKGENNLNNAMFKFALLLNENPDKEDIKVITNKLQAIVSPDELKRIIELAEELNDKPEEESEQETNDEPKQSTGESNEFEDS